MNVLVWALIGYAAGTLPSTWLLAVFTGHRDALASAKRSAGEGDAHFVLREAGAGKASAWAATADVVKAFIPTLVAVLAVGPYEAAACAVGVVAGHCWPPMLRELAGRGLAAAAGAYLAMLPIEMVLGGAITGLGSLAKVGGASSTVGFGAIPLLAMWRSEPEPYRLAAWVILVLILVRRLEGVKTDLDAGASPVRAVVQRAVFDRSP